jgi:PhzF family phenazine biosynthesis protein
VRRVRIRHVDAFTSTPLEGNPAAVADGAGLDGATMQLIALNQKLSETVFLFPPDDPANSARVRIFTPMSELPFAGHPIVASAHILYEEVIAEGTSLRLETGAGVIPVGVDGAPARYTMTQAAPQFRAASVSAADVAAAVGLAADDIALVDDVSTGLFWTVAQLASPEAMSRVRPDAQRLSGMQLAVFCIGGDGAGADIHVRAFVAPQGIPEDPVTGSANGCIGAFIARHRLLRARNGAIRYVAEQGIEMGQPGRVYVGVRADGESSVVEVGGEAVTVLRGELLLPDA